MLLSILPVAGKDEGRNGKSQQINTILLAEFLDFHHGSIYITPRLLVIDTVCPIQKGERIFTRSNQTCGKRFKLP